MWEKKNCNNWIDVLMTNMAKTFLPRCTQNLENFPFFAVFRVKNYVTFALQTCFLMHFCYKIRAILAWQNGTFLSKNVTAFFQFRKKVGSKIKISFLMHFFTKLEQFWLKKVPFFLKFPTAFFVKKKVIGSVWNAHVQARNWFRKAIFAVKFKMNGSDFLADMYQLA